MKRVGLNGASSRALSCAILASILAMPAGQAKADTAPLPLNPMTNPNPAPPPDREVGGTVSEIRIIGNAHVQSPDVLSKLRQKVGQPFNATDVEADRQSVYAMGLFTSVTVKVEPGDHPGEIRETYAVVENPTIKAIAFRGNSAFPSAKLQSVMTTKIGEVLNTNKLDQDIQNVINVYRDKGYRASISEDIDINPTTGVLTIPVVEARVTAVQVTGNRKTKTHVITREMKQKPGALYNTNVFSDDLKRIFNTNLFENVGPAEISTPNVGSVVLSIPVQERRTGNVSVGVGYSSTEKLVGRAQLSESNFRGIGETVAIMWEVGGTQSTSSVDVSFADPWIDKNHTGLNVDVFDKVVYRFSNTFLSGTTNGTDAQYLERHVGASLALSRPLDDRPTTVSVTTRGESVSSNDVALPLAEEFIRQDATIYGLGGRITRSTRDNNLNPADGGFYSFSAEGVYAQATTVGNAPSPITPDWHTSPKCALDLRQYMSLQGKRAPGKLTESKRVLAVRVLAGYEGQSTPFSEQYFIGGADTLRGFDESRFWGSNMLVTSVELRIPVGSSITGVLFTDVGDAWNSVYQGTALDQHYGLNLQSDVGFGIRVQTPIGPIRLDYGISDTGGHTNFSIGQSF
ncbi:MAG: BamA/TamA family outer membrane protein [Capsulimonadaceae bacterium]|nr:BamA/TamA family outer membrane protein [Capsulimonadaceae bacterium]